MVRLLTAWLSGNIKGDSFVFNFALFNNVVVLIILWQRCQSVIQWSVNFTTKHMEQTNPCLITVRERLLSVTRELIDFVTCNC